MTLAQDIARRMLQRRQQPATAKAPSPPAKVTPKRPEPAQAAKPVLVNVPVPRIDKPAERRVAAVPLVDQGPRLRSAPYVPPRRAEPDITALVDAFAPPSPQPSPLPPPVLSPGFRGSCKAVCATTGRTCKLPAHPGEPDRHRHERGPFFRVAAPGTTSFPLRQALDAVALSQAPHAAELVERKSDAQEKRESRRSAHAGDAVTTGLKHLDSNAANHPHEDTEAA